MLNQPLVSVLMTAYNREKYIAEAIESVLAQTYANWELIIVDDGSEDKTVSISQSFQNKDNRINVYVNEKNLGDYLNRNVSASYAKGEFIKYLDADDLMYPWCLDAMVFCMQKFPEVAYGLIASSNLNLQIIYPKIYTPEDAYITYFFNQPILIIGPTGAIIRTKYFREVNGFSGIHYIGDTELWLKLSAKYSMIIMPPDLIWWRTHDNQQSVYESKYDKAEKMRYEMVIKALNNNACPIKGDISKIAIRNQMNIRIRHTLYLSFKTFKFLALKKYFKDFDFSILDALKAFRRNKNPFKQF
jgi:glycosyltransferase involved in cell wall biosynthesis